MHVFARNRGLSCVCSPALALASGGPARLQSPFPALAGVSRRPDWHANGIQVGAASRPENSPPALRHEPQFVTDSSQFLTEHGAVVVGSSCAPLPQEQRGVATQNLLLHANAWAGKRPVNERVDNKLPPVPQLP